MVRIKAGYSETAGRCISLCLKNDPEQLDGLASFVLSGHLEMYIVPKPIFIVVCSAVKMDHFSDQYIYEVLLYCCFRDMNY